MPQLRHVPLGFTIDFACLIAAAPPLFFPSFFPNGAPVLALALLFCGLFWRRWSRGYFFKRSPVDPLILLFLFVLLPVSIWVSPGDTRMTYAIPRGLILTWDVCMFWAIVTYASTSVPGLSWASNLFFLAGAGISLLAPFGMNWLYKIPLLSPILERIPLPLVGVFRGAEGGFSPNQVAGAILYILPLGLALVVFDARKPHTAAWWLRTVCVGVMTVVLLLTQSRSALLGLMLSGIFLILMPSARGRWGLVAGIAVLCLTVPFWVGSLVAMIGDAAPDVSYGSASTLNVRFEIWQRALWGIQDFPITGMGFGTFRELARPLYVMPSMPPEYDFAHAHNFFLQTALDFGVPGLIVMLALYLVVMAQLVNLWHSERLATPEEPLSKWRIWAIGFGASLIAQTVYSQLDAVTLGSKPSFLMWFMFALVMAAVNLAMGQTSCRQQVCD